MDWNSNLRTFIPRPDQSSFNFLYNYNYDQHPGMNVKYLAMAKPAEEMIIPGMEINYGSHQETKKKKLTSEQLESLERSFQEEIKLEPDRKMKLSRELGLQPRQIAVWFQNRRARWKAKQLERLYDALKHEFNVVSMEKHKLQEEVMKLKAVIGEQASGRKQASKGYTEISGEETVESTSAVAIRSPSKARGTSSNHHYHQITENNNNYLLSVDEQYNYNSVPSSSSTYWAALPSYP